MMKSNNRKPSETNYNISQPPKDVPTHGAMTLQAALFVAFHRLETAAFQNFYGDDSQCFAVS